MTHPYKKPADCYYCGSSASLPFAEENGFTLVKCRGCGLLYVNPRPPAGDISRAAQTGLHSGGDSLDTTGRYNAGRVLAYLAILKDIYKTPFQPKKPLYWLDIGCGYGEFLEALQVFHNRRIVTHGIEPNTVKRRSALERGLLVAQPGDTGQTGLYDFISLLNVYPHLPDPPAQLNEWKNLLKPGGELLLETGHSCHLENSAHHRPFYLPDHLSFANREIVTGLLEKTGFSIISVHHYPQFDIPDLDMFIRAKRADTQFSAKSFTLSPPKLPPTVSPNPNPFAPLVKQIASYGPGKKIALWGWSEAGITIYRQLAQQGIAVNTVIDNFKQGKIKGKNVKTPENTDFNKIDAVVFGILRDTSALQNEIMEKFPHIRCFSTDPQQPAGSPGVVDHVLTPDEIENFRRDFYPKQPGRWITRKEFLTGSSTPDIPRCLKAIREKDFSTFSYGEEYNRLILRIISELSSNSPGRSLQAADIGCVSGLYPSMLLAQSHHVTIFDVRPIHADAPRLSSKQIDLCSPSLPEDIVEKFDLVTSISTVEHIGLGRYGDPLDPGGDFKLVNGIHRILKPGGIFVCSVPTGPGCVVYNLHRVYSQYRLDKLFSAFQLLEVKTSYPKRTRFITGDDRYQPIFILVKQDL